MRPQISWADLAGERVGLWGLGTEGAVNLRRLRAMGVEPVIVDDHPERIPAESVLPSAAGGTEALLGCSVVVKTPGISRHRSDALEIQAAGIPLVGGLGLWLESIDRSRVLCITGTKGKSTTTSVATHLATGLGLTAVAGGNLGVPPYDVDAPTDVDLWVIEVSSYQATDVASSPPVVAVTSLYPDHIPWHGDVETYYRDKLSLCSQPGARLTVAAATSPLLVERAALLGPEVEWVPQEGAGGAWAEPLGLLGTHNAVNAEVARRCLVAMGIPGADDDEALQRAAHGFGALDSRLEPVTEIDGVQFVDDSLSTNVLPTLAAVDAFPGRRIALIAGGFDRQLDYTPLAVALSEREAPTLVLTAYTTGPQIAAALDRYPSAQLETLACIDLTEAVRRGAEWAKPDGVVLLSPAAASFDAFDDYRHRARVFREAIAELR